MVKRKNPNNRGLQLEFDYSERPTPNLIMLEEAAKKYFPLIESFHHSTLMKKDYNWKNMKQFKIDQYIIFKTGRYTYLFLSVLEYERATSDNFIHAIAVTVKEDTQKATEILKQHLNLHVVPSTGQPILIYRVNGGTARAPIDVLKTGSECVDTFLILIDHLSYSEPFHEVILGDVMQISNLATKYKDMLISNVANFINPPSA